MTERRLEEESSTRGRNIRPHLQRQLAMPDVVKNRIAQFGIPREANRSSGCKQDEQGCVRRPVGVRMNDVPKRHRVLGAPKWMTKVKLSQRKRLRGAETLRADWRVFLFCTVITMYSTRSAATVFVGAPVPHFSLLKTTPLKPAKGFFCCSHPTLLLLLCFIRQI